MKIVIKIQAIDDDGNIVAESIGNTSVKTIASEITMWFMEQFTAVKMKALFGDKADG